VSALGMMIAHVGLHFPVPSVSGQAVLTMPVLVPLADLLGLSRQVVVLAYQYGAGLAELVTPTNGAMMAIVAAAGVSYERWLRFAVPWMCALLGLGAAAILLAVAVGLR
ncbi:MAG: YfcC family protein, partial [Gemmatimonadales bacterium]